MKKLQNYTLQKFLDNFIEELKYENEIRTRCNYYDKKKLDIPFIISSLYQSFDKYPDVYKEFVEDLKRDDDYQIVIDDPNNEYEIINVSIYIYEFNESLDYHYQLKFYYEDRNYGYCECTPDMEDYSEDKHCCGHGCDATFCRFEFKKVLNVFGGGWEGDEHDYWDFEDEFYASEKELADKKAEEEKKNIIKMLKERIAADSKRLAEIEAGGE